MKKMKKVLACAVAATMTESLAACSSGNSTETSAPTEAAKADATEAAVAAVLKEGYRTTDIMSEGCTLVGTDKMGDLIAERV